MITIGATASNRSSALTLLANTFLCKSGYASGDGVLTSFEVWFNATGSGVKIGTFSGSGTSWASNDWETIGSVTSGSKQTFTGLNCNVSANNAIGIYGSAGEIDNGTSPDQCCYVLGDQFGTGSQTYSNYSGPLSLYGSGPEPAVLPLMLSSMRGGFNNNTRGGFVN